MTITLTPAPALVTYFESVDSQTFRFHFENARSDSRTVRQATSSMDDVTGTRYFLDFENRAGFAIRPNGELVFVHSLTRGLGDAIVTTAIRHGATNLDCFDGYLTGFYARHGFIETHRAANWNGHGPDVVWMALPYSV